MVDFSELTADAIGIAVVSNVAGNLINKKKKKKDKFNWNNKGDNKW